LDVVSGEGYHIETAIHSLKAPILSAEPQTGGFKQALFLRVTLAAASPYRATAHLDKDGDGAVAHDEVNFAATLASIGGDKTQALAFQPAASTVFPCIAGLFA
jgi:hypothetical protein